MSGRSTRPSPAVRVVREPHHERTFHLSQPSRSGGLRASPQVVREPEYYPTLFEATIRVYRHHSPDVPTYNPTQMMGYYGLTWDYTVMNLFNCPISGPKTGIPQTCRVPGCPAFCFLLVANTQASQIPERQDTQRVC